MKNQEENFIDISKSAVDKIAELMEGRNRGPMAIRVVLHGRIPGGGYQSEFKLVALDDKQDDDITQDTGTFPVYLDPASAESIKGAKVDFDENRYSAGFHIEYPEQIYEHSGPERKNWEDPTAIAVQDAIDKEVNPSLAGHGGWVALLDVKEESAYIEMGGGCQGCGLSEATLKQGIEQIIQRKVPEIQKVLDVTDHAEGKNPYYSGEWQGGESALGG